MRPHLKSGRGAGEGDLVHIDIASHNLQKEDEKYPDSDEGEIEGDGIKKKKRRGRPKKVKPYKEYEGEEFSSAKNDSLTQLLRASKAKEEKKAQEEQAKFYKTMNERLAGEGLGKRPAKGTPEMKEWMAKLRSLKKK